MAEAAKKKVTPKKKKTAPKKKIAKKAAPRKRGIKRSTETPAKTKKAAPKKPKVASPKTKAEKKPKAALAAKKTVSVKEELAFVEFEVPLDEITLGDHQPRARDGIQTRGSLTQLKESIRDIGLLQPILVQRQEEGGYLLISGERRYTACKELGHSKIRAVLPSNRTVHAMEKRGKTLDELALFENLQRKNLTPIEEGRCFEKLLGILSLTQAELGGRLGLKQPYVNERLGFMKLPIEVQDMIEEGQISTSQARELNRLSALPDAAEKQIGLAKQLLIEKLTVRKAKKLVDGLLGQTKKRTGEHLTRLGAKKAAYFIATLNDKFEDIDLTDFEGEEDEVKLQKLADDLPALIKKLQGLKRAVFKMVD